MMPLIRLYRDETRHEFISRFISKETKNVGNTARDRKQIGCWWSENVRQLKRMYCAIRADDYQNSQEQQQVDIA